MTEENRRAPGKGAAVTVLTLANVASLVGVAYMLVQINDIAQQNDRADEVARGQRPTLQVQWVQAGPDLDGASALERVQRVVAGNNATVAGPDLGLDAFDGASDQSDPDVSAFLASEGCDCAGLQDLLDQSEENTDVRWIFLVISQHGGSPALNIRVSGEFLGAGDLGFYALDDLDTDIFSTGDAPRAQGEDVTISVPTIDAGSSVIVPLFAATTWGDTRTDSYGQIAITRSFLPAAILYDDTLGNLDARLDVRKPLETPALIGSALEIRG